MQMVGTPDMRECDCDINTLETKGAPLEPKNIRWATQPQDAGRIEQLPGISALTATEIPQIGSTITHPYLVDPSTKQSIPLLVADAYIHEATGDAVVVLKRPD